MHIKQKSFKELIKKKFTISFSIFILMTLIYPIGILFNSYNLQLAGHALSIPPVPLVFFQNEIAANVHIVSFKGSKSKKEHITSSHLGNIPGPGYRVSQYLIPLFINLSPDLWKTLYKNSLCKLPDLQKALNILKKPDAIEIQVTYRNPILINEAKYFWVSCYE